MASVQGAQRRQYFRLRYPKHARPIIRLEDRKFSVCESSEKGLRIMMGQMAANLYCGLQMKATLSLHDDNEVAVEGSILRFDDNEVVVILDKGLSFKDMVAEQRYVKQKFPNFFSAQRQSLQYVN